MFIDANAITDLIKKYEAISSGMSLTDARRSWADGVVRDLEGLIDQEAGRLEKMADQWHDEEWVEIELESGEAKRGRLGGDGPEVDFNWPHGV